VLLAISMTWVMVSIALMGAVYKYRRLKVFKVASPTFLCVTLLGCAIMYAEVNFTFDAIRRFLLLGWQIDFLDRRHIRRTDGRHFPRAEHAGLRGHQVDPSHGILHHFQFTLNEDLEVQTKFEFSIQKKSGKKKKKEFFQKNITRKIVVEPRPGFH
jgi:hypothetical protein